MRILTTLLLAVILTIGVACSGNGSTVSLDKDTKRMLETALSVSSGLEITEIKTTRDGISITYEQVTGDSQAVMMQRWLDLAVVTMSFLDEPTTIIIHPTGSGATVSRVTIEAGDIASLLIGEISFEAALSRIKVEK